MPSRVPRSPAAGRALALWIAACSLTLGPIGCGADAPPRPRAVVLFVIDTLRADRLGAYGSELGLTPHLDALARESVVFERAHAPAPWTLPSVASLLTSTYPCEHAVLVDGDRLPQSLPTLAEGLAAAGYRSASLYENPYAGPMSGLDRGFDRAEAAWDTGLGGVARRIDGLLPEPFFLYLHTTDPHDPYLETRLGPSVALDPEERKALNRSLQHYRRLTRADWAAGRPPGSTDNTYEQLAAMADLDAHRDEILDLYAQDVARADARLGNVVAALRARGLFEDALFVVVSDHGEAFGEHGGWQHDQSVYEELLHVPLLIHMPGGRFAGRRVETPVSLLDVAPTVLEIAGAPVPDGLRGRSLLSRIEGREASAEANDEPPIRVTGMRIDRKKHFRPAHRLRGDRNVAARQGPWKSIWNVDRDTVELYRLAEDPGETHDVAALHPERARAMREASERWLASCRPVARDDIPERGVDPRQLERLRALGYAD